MIARRFDNIVGPLTGANNISAWMASLGTDGKWPDSEVDYTTGCQGRRAAWPAQDHWQRILRMSAAWHGGMKDGEQFVKNAKLHDKISLAMDYWFGRDFTNPGCLYNGGTADCPCNNLDNSLWNTNWYDNVILIPSLAGQSCLLLNDTLTTSQVGHCINMTGRSFDLFLVPLEEVSFMTGANVLDIAKIGIDGALLNLNVTQLTEAYQHIHETVVLQLEIKIDGIRPDGSFGQHKGVLYNGNYGKDFSNDVLDLEIQAAQTRFAAGEEPRSNLATLYDGNRWMIYYNTLTGVAHWDYSALGRFISFSALDSLGPVKGLNTNLTKVRQLGELWNNSILTEFAQSLSGGSNSANIGQVLGNRMFWDFDYMVHRGRNYVSTVKMFSTRTKNTECLNSQNPFGFHLSDGVHYTYLKGNEYEDISVAWDWNLLPGITTDYGATNLSCNETEHYGIESFVGGVSTGDIGIAVMRYTNPSTKSLQWQKAWVFLENDIQHVMVSNVTSTTDKPVLSSLDQRRHDGPIFTNDGEKLEIYKNSSKNLTLDSGVKSLWHGGVGYTFPDLSSSDGNHTLHVEVGEKSGDWTTIGIGTQPPATVDLFAAWIEHGSLSSGGLSYSMFPGTTSFSSFTTKRDQLKLQEISNNGNVSAVYDETHQTVFVVFWNENGGNITFTPNSLSTFSKKLSSITITSSANTAIIYRFDDAAIWISDPSQSLDSVEISFGRKPMKWGLGREKKFVVDLPRSEGLAGSSVRVDF
ncbi:Chondroitinase-AC [Leucoagaricus sp. SymC.cos]|nr:Chondroitinase-AC [Leucoagaricus sp. SymC.cos]